MDALLRFVLDPARAVPRSDQLRTWWEATIAARAAWTTPVDRALAGGACADRLGFAFAAGYAEALHVLVPDLPPGSINALCATEDAGVHPRAIRTRLVATAPGRYELSGHKKWGTLATLASSLLVVASTGEDAGKNVLRVVRVRPDAPGVRFIAATTPFVPEVPHAEVALDRVATVDADLLPGDGYDDYLKPFRTIEDIHVHAAITGYLIHVARRRSFSRELQQHLVAHAVTVRSLALADPRAATTHVALAGALDVSHRLVGDIERSWAATPDDEWLRWQRDRALLGVAGQARAARLERAWATLEQPS
jgi:alkylation response protein AidB-like acyl-CoA dehydrogenase